MQNIAINHSADIDYKDFIKIYKKCTENPYNFLTIDTTQSVDKKFKKVFIKMIIKENIKILDGKIKQIRADYDLYRQNAKISTLSNGKLDKYEYLTCEDLGYRPDPVQKTKFEYSPLGQVFNKGLDADEKQEGLLKRLKNIEDKTDNQLQAIEDQINNQSVLKSIVYSIRDKLPEKAIKAFDNLLAKDKTINYKILSKELGSDYYDYTMIFSMGEILRQIYYGNILIPGAEREQNEFYYLLEDLKKISQELKNKLIKKKLFKKIYKIFMMEEKWLLMHLRIK